MTGFAQARREAEGVSVTVTMKSGNQRYFEPRWQVPPECEPWLPELGERLRREVRRGHVEIRVAIAAAAAAAAPRLDAALVEAYLSAHAALNERLELRAPPAAADLLRFPGVFTAAAAAPAAAAARPLLLAAFDEALAELVGMRRREGAALVHDLERRLERIGALRAAIAGLRPQLEAANLERLQRRMQELLASAAIAPERLLQEAALMAERSDVSEELTRLDSHLHQCRALLAAGGEIGKKLDFLSQELNREANTLMSKTTAASAAA
ncbi:MAG: YicC/YloC family endoribonuclease, partial [Terriglobales bacterium]